MLTSTQILMLSRLHFILFISLQTFIFRLTIQLRNCSQTLFLETFFPVCSNGDVRLVAGATAQEGRVEFCNNSVWGTVCDDGWDSADAGVVCRQLGFSPQGAQALSSAFFGEGTGSILFVRCVGTEDRLADCPQSGLGNDVCAHSADAGVRCLIETPTPGQ